MNEEEMEQFVDDLWYVMRGHATGGNQLTTETVEKIIFIVDEWR